MTISYNSVECRIYQGHKQRINSIYICMYFMYGHWVLFVCSIKQRKIELFDSLWNTARSNLANIFVVSFLNYLFSVDSTNKWNIINHGIAMP